MWSEKSSWPGVSEQIEDGSVVFERHHARHHRDAARLFDRHPVRPRVAPVALGLHLARELNGAAQKQQLLGQRRLARVRVRNDREGAPPRDLVSKRRKLGAPVDGALADVSVMWRNLQFESRRPITPHGAKVTHAEL